MSHVTVTRLSEKFYLSLSLSLSLPLWLSLSLCILYLGGTPLAAAPATSVSLKSLARTLYARTRTNVAECGYKCSADDPSTCSAIACGDGKLAGSGLCDDGNPTIGDGCSNTCTVEADHESAGSKGAWNERGNGKEARSVPDG